MEKQADDTYLLVNPGSGSQEWLSEHTATITISDEGSGLASGAELQYGWSTSQTSEPTTWNTVEVTGYVAGATSASVTITGNGLNGKYYLWVKPVELQDTKGNIRTSEEVSDVYYFDNEGPQITIGGTVNEAITADTLTTEDYGGYVTNYTPINGVNDEGTQWRIFHTDGENIYLIADSYVPLTNEAGTKNYIPTTELNPNGTEYRNGKYGFSLFFSWEDIDSSIASKWLSKYTVNENLDNGLQTMYLLDLNAWSGFKDNTYADYAVGGPTIELFAASYNVTHETDIDTQVTSNGYQAAWTGETFNNGYISGLNTNESLYVISNTFNDTVYGMWLASPASSLPWMNSYVLYDGRLGCFNPNEGETLSLQHGARPIICLNSNVALEKQEDGTYTIASGNETWSQSHTETITITDADSGLAEGAEIQYGWSTSTETEPSSWTTVEVTGYSAGDTSASIEVTGDEITGKYYLWVKPVNVQDTQGNAQIETEISNNQYYFDNTPPTVTVTRDNQSLEIVIADVGSGLVSTQGKYYISTSATALENGEWLDYTSGTAINFTQTCYLFVETVSDNSQNTSTQNGKITTIDGINYHRFGPYDINDNEAPEIIIGTTASTLTAEEYGGYVTNYTPINGVNDEGIKWRIFHTDGENIYLIADSYVPRTNEAGTKNYVPTGYTKTNGTYGFNLYGYQNYNGTADIESSIASKWLSKYTLAGYTATSQNINAKATAYLLDTNAWSGFKDSTYSEYAVGCPTLELFAASYNKTHTDRTIETKVASEWGYDVAWSDGDFGNYYISGLNTSESLYVISNTFDGVFGMCLASPSGINTDPMIRVQNSGSINHPGMGDYSLRFSPNHLPKYKCNFTKTIR